MSNDYQHSQGVRLTFTPAEFAELNRQARKHKKPVREFTEWMVRCFINSVQAEAATRTK